ncbi:MAG: radical SAM protein [Vicinamibacteria bacterium]
MIRPGVPAPSLAPLMGTVPLRERGDVVYRELRARSLLNRCSSPRMPFEWTVNPYRGCAMGCRYCYATYTHEFMGITAPEAFHSAVFVKRGAEDETARRLAAVVRRGERIALGTATDPYQPGEPEEGVTRRFLEAVAQHRGVRLGITTKGAAILRDIDLLKRIHERSSLVVHVSLISLDAALLRRVEPWAPTPDVRIEMLRRMAEAGITVGLSVAPILPALTDRAPDLAALLARAAGVGVRRMSYSLLFLRSPTRERYLRWIAQEFPRYLEAYGSAYSQGAYLPGRYRRGMRDTIERLRAVHGLDSDFEQGGAAARLPRLPEQLPLWA